MLRDKLKFIKGLETSVRDCVRFYESLELQCLLIPKYFCAVYDYARKLQFSMGRHVGRHVGGRKPAKTSGVYLGYFKAFLLAAEL